MFDASAMELVRMAHKSAKKIPPWRPTFLRPWREAAGFTLEQVAAEVGIKHSQLSKIERGLAPYSQRILEAYADICSCTPADLLMRAPHANPEIHALVEALSDEQRRYAAAMLRGLSGAPKRPQ